jgi:hypothetical protein
MTTGEENVRGKWYHGKSQTIATCPGSNQKNVYRVKRNCEGIRRVLFFVYLQSRRKGCNAYCESASSS